jgi:hypothetical protein
MSLRHSRPREKPSVPAQADRFVIPAKARFVIPAKARFVIPAQAGIQWSAGQ